MSIDYFSDYFSSDGIDLPRLVNDDFLESIRLLYTNGHYVSAAKLTVIFVDSMAYVEYGDAVRNPFVKWLDTYAKLSSVGITSEELWEHRNSLLHMSNLDSRKVAAGHVRRLILYVGKLPDGLPDDDDEGKLYDFHALMMAIINALEPWFQSYNDDRSKIDEFISRYDLVVSDNRMMKVNLVDE